jgi:hypothetical protein
MNATSIASPIRARSSQRAESAREPQPITRDTLAA